MPLFLPLQGSMRVQGSSRTSVVAPLRFLGGRSELEEKFKRMDLGEIERFVIEQGCQWEVNPPHASHFGGVWERQIYTIRRVLDGMFVELGKTQLTDELLVTLMAEVTGIVNA